MSSIIKVDTIQDQDGNNIINENANTITIGKAGDTVTVASGATFVGGGISWQSVQTTGFTAVAGNGYFCNTTSAGFTVTLPATPSAGDQIQLVDYAGTFDTNPLVINPNGNKIEGGTDNLQLGAEREGATLTYIDSTQGWLATSGINEGTDALSTLPYSVDFLVVAGGAGGGRENAGGGGAGGYRNSYSTESSGGGGSSETNLSFSAGTVYTITVGAGGPGGQNQDDQGTDGLNSSISGSDITTITSIGGGGGGAGGGAVPTANLNGRSGGSGGGGGEYSPNQGSGGSGTANQGFAGGSGVYSHNYDGGGGGGAGSVGADSASDTIGGDGGNGLSSSITGSAVNRAGGGGGGGDTFGGAGGSSVGGNGGNGSSGATNAIINTGSGGGGSREGTYLGANGSSGVVILRMPDANYSTITTGSPTVTTGVGGTDTVLVFNSSGSYTG